MIVATAITATTTPTYIRGIPGEVIGIGDGVGVDIGVGVGVGVGEGVCEAVGLGLVDGVGDGERAKGHTRWSRIRLLTVSTKITVDHVCASAAIPLIFEPVRLKTPQG